MQCTCDVQANWVTISTILKEVTRSRITSFGSKRASTAPGLGLHPTGGSTVQTVVARVLFGLNDYLHADQERQRFPKTRIRFVGGTRRATRARHIYSVPVPQNAVEAQEVGREETT